MSKNNIIGDNIRRLIKENHITQAALAEAVGTSRQQIGAFVNGRHSPNTITLVKIADVLGVTQYDLLGSDKDNKIADTGRFVLAHPTLSRITDMVKDDTITDDQLNKVVEVITSLKQ